jgi:hypothetical protein
MNRQTTGPLNACACPWCRKANDFRGLEDYGVEPGNILACDHCGKNFEVMRVQPVTMVWLAPTTARGNLQR